MVSQQFAINIKLAKVVSVLMVLVTVLVLVCVLFLATDLSHSLLPGSCKEERGQNGNKTSLQHQD